MLMGHVLAWCEFASLSISLSHETQAFLLYLSRRLRLQSSPPLDEIDLSSTAPWAIDDDISLYLSPSLKLLWSIDGDVASSLSLSPKPLWWSTMFSPRLSRYPRRLVEKHAHASVLVSLSPRRLCDESLGVSRCRSPRGWSSSISLSRRLAVSISSRMKNHFTPLSGPELSSTKSKAR